MKLELSGITKKFGALVANDSVNLTVEPGQIHCLLGENGAGKSTLMNVLYGLYQADAGDILLDGKAVKFSGPGDAMAAGIGMVHQHFMLIPVFTVAENVVLGHEPVKAGGWLDLAALPAARRTGAVGAPPPGLTRPLSPPWAPGGRGRNPQARQSRARYGLSAHAAGSCRGCRASSRRSW